jgi:cyanophycinase-like exopeptidase
VAILIVPDGEAADQPFVYDTVVAAETVWIAGGDQSNYINFWKGRKLQQALAERISRGVVIGGISAGLNILTDFVFTAQGSTAITSSFALANPDSPQITLDRDFVKLDPVKGLIGDAHFVTRDRMGRDLTFLYRIDQQWPHERVRGVSVDEATAVVITGTTGDWSAKIVGAGNAYFLEPVDLPRTLPAGSPLDGVTVNVFRIGPGGGFGISKYPWGGTPYRVTVTKGLVQSDPPGQPIY